MAFQGVDASVAVTEDFVKFVPMTRMTKAGDIPGSLIGVLDNAGVDWARAVGVATDGTHSMTGKKAGVVAEFKEKVHTASEGLSFWTFHCIIHKEAICCKSLKIDHVMEVVLKAVGFMHARG